MRPLRRKLNAEYFHGALAPGDIVTPMAVRIFPDGSPQISSPRLSAPREIIYTDDATGNLAAAWIPPDETYCG